MADTGGGTSPGLPAVQEDRLEHWDGQRKEGINGGAFGARPCKSTIAIPGMPDVWGIRVRGMPGDGEGAGMIVQGDARRLPLPDASVQCVVTSPPYWGLRDYGLEPKVWDGEPMCAHEWDDWQESHDERESTNHGKTRTTDRFYGNESRRFDGNHQKHSAGAFCQRCGAWRGVLGLEPTPDLYVAHMVEIFREVRRVLHPSGTVWLNLGDSYAANRSYQVTDNKHIDVGNNHGSSVPLGLKPKDLCGIPWRVAFGLQADGWWLRSEITLCKKNPMPESCQDRPTSATEKMFLLTKSPDYFFDQDSVRERASDTGRENGRKGRAESEDERARPPGSNPRTLKRLDYSTMGRNIRNWWPVTSEPFPEAHFATFGQKWVEPCILAGTSERGCCAKCGQPWKRVMKRDSAPPNVFTNRNAPSDELVKAGSRLGGVFLGMGQKLQNWRAEHPTETVGWAPGCKCGAETVPCLVLDPFAGAGTVGLVTARLGRRFVGIEMKAEYCRMAARRITESQKSDAQKKQEILELQGQARLF